MLKVSSIEFYFGTVGFVGFYFNVTHRYNFVITL